MIIVMIQKNAFPEHRRCLAMDCSGDDVQVGRGLKGMFPDQMFSDDRVDGFHLKQDASLSVPYAIKIHDTHGLNAIRTFPLVIRIFRPSLLAYGFPHISRRQDRIDRQVVHSSYCV